MNELEITEKINIENMIYEIRGKQVMLDSDLAKLYKCINGTKTINLAVKRNIERFPLDFYFQLTKQECSRFQFETLNKKRGENIKYLPYVFTEQGVAMLATILRTPIAAEVSISIMRAFVSMRKYISNELTNVNIINSKLLEHDNRINLLEESFSKLSEKQKINTLFYDGQIYDAYSLLMEILDNAIEEIIIIDNYAGKELLNILKDINKKIIIVSSNINDILMKKYTSQYKNIEFIRNDLFHDRFIIIDRKILYNCGSSFKDLGKKCFGIHLMEDEEYLKIILNKI